MAWAAKAQEAAAPYGRRGTGSGQVMTEESRARGKGVRTRLEVASWHPDTYMGACRITLWTVLADGLRVRQKKGTTWQ